MPSRIALLAQPRFIDRYHARLPKMALRAVREILAKNPEIDEALIQQQVVDRCELQPLEIGELWSVSLELKERQYLSTYRVRASGYFAEAEALYRGSGVLWGAKPSNTFDWIIGGTVLVDRVRISTVCDSRNWDSVVRTMEEYLQAARKAVNELGPTVIMYNLKVGPALAPIITTYVERLRDGYLQARDGAEEEEED